MVMKETGRKHSKLKKIHSILKPWYIIVLILFLWWLAARLQIWNSYLLPAPEKVAKTLVSMAKRGEIAQAVFISLRRVLTGFAISFTLAFVCALISTYAPQAAEYFRYLGNVFRNVPPIAMISLLILWFGLGETPKLIIIVLASFFPMTMNIATGFAQCDRRLLEVGKSLHFSEARQFFKITLPASRMNILTGIRIGLGYSWRALIGAEMFAAAAGLGYMIVFAQQMSRSDKVLIGILLIGMIGAVSDAVLRFLIDRAGGDGRQTAGGAAEPEIPESGNAATPSGTAEAAAFYCLRREADGGRCWVEIPVTETGQTDGQAAVAENAQTTGKDIRLWHVTKQFSSDKGDISILRDATLSIASDQITVVLGKSGCGKTTLLRMIAGLDRDYEGSIVIPDDKRCAVVFQESRLMPWLRVRENITFGLKKAVPKRRGAGGHTPSARAKDAIREEKVRGLLTLTGLGEFERMKPAQLSGGMRQRTAIARALAMEPDFLLMDEPFAALDYFTRTGMQRSLLDIQKKTGCGILFITHSIDEALVLADQILIMGEGKVYKRYRLTDKTDPSGGDGRDLSELKEDILINI